MSGHGHRYVAGPSYALALCEAGRFDRARLILLRCTDDQDADPASPTYGLWGYYAEEPVAHMRLPDWNRADFIGRAPATVLLRHRPSLPDAVRAAVLAASGHAARCVDDEAVRRGAERLMAVAWAHLARHWHAPSGQQTGPMPRAYGDDAAQHAGLLMFLRKALGGAPACVFERILALDGAAAHVVAGHMAEDLAGAVVHQPELGLGHVPAVVGTDAHGVLVGNDPLPPRRAARDGAPRMAQSRPR